MSHQGAVAVLTLHVSVRWRRWLIIGGLALAVLGIALGVLLASRSEPDASAVPPEVVAKLEADQSDRRTIVQPIIIESGSDGAVTLWVSLLTALGGLMSGAGTLAAVWVRAEKSSAADEPDD